MIELLVVSLVLTVIVAGLLSLYRISATEQDRVEGTTRGLINQRVGLERMTREIRQADQICSAYPACGSSFTDASSIDIRRCQGGGGGGCTQLWVRFNCSGSPAQAVPPNLTARGCLRSQSSTATGLGSGEQRVVSDVATSPAGIFSFASPSYVTISLRVMTKGATTPIVLEDGVRIRNAPAS